MNLGELKTEVFELLGDDGTDPKHFTVAEITRYINDTIRRLAAETGCLEVEHVLTLTADVGVYDLPTYLARIFRVSYDEERIGGTSVYELDRYSREWQTETGEVQNYYLDKIEQDQIGFWHIPEFGFGVLFDSDFGVLIDHDGTVAMLTNLSAPTLGCVTDYTSVGYSMAFVAAASGGGADFDYGIAVDVDDDDTGSTYSMVGSYGVIINVQDSTDLAFSAVEFTDGTTSTFDELGVVVDISTDDGSDQYIFDSELGVVIDSLDPASSIRIWAKQDPDDLVNDADVPALPLHSHQAIAFGAAGKALLKNSEIRNPELAGLLMAMEKDSSGFLRRLVVRRSGEAKRQMRSAILNTRNSRIFPRLPGSYPRTRY